MIRTGLSFPLIAAAVVASALASGCQKDPPPAQPYNGQYPQQPGAYPQQPGAYPQQPGAYPQQPGAQPGAQPQPGYPPGPQPGTDPNQPQPQPQPQPGAAPGPGGFPFPIPGMPGSTPPAGGGGASGGTAQPLDPNFAAAATGPLQVQAASQAPGMQKEGPPVAGNFQTGQTLEGAFTFQPGKCYTLLGQGAGITQLDLEIVYVAPFAVPGAPPLSAGKSSTRGAQASIGAGSGCLKPMSPMAAQAKFIVKATAGAGLGAAQLYSK